MKVSSHRHDQSLTQSPVLFPEDGEWGGNCQASNHSLFFLVTSSYPAAMQEPIKSPFIRTKDTLITQEISRDLGGLCQKPGQGPNIRTKDVPSAFIIQEITRVSRIQGRDQCYIFSILIEGGKKKKKAGVVGASLSSVLHSQFLCMLTWQISIANAYVSACRVF